MAITDPNDNRIVEDTGANTEKFAGGNLWNFIVKLNNQNTDDANGEFTFPSSMILELCIEEDLLHWPYKGYMIYDNRLELLERVEPEYTFRMDGHDELTVSIELLVKKTNGDDFPEDIWTMNFDFVVYDSEDLPSSNISTKTKKLYFWDKRYQMMMDKNIEWSTSTDQDPPLTHPALATDKERSMNTGTAMKSILESGGFEDFVDDDWSTGGSIIQYVSPATNSINDDLEYLVNKHIHETSVNGKDFNDVCVLKIDRATQKLQLKSLSSFFDEAGDTAAKPGDRQRAHLFFEDYAGEGETMTDPLRAPYGDYADEDQDLYKKDIKMIEWSKILTYNFVDMAGIDNTNNLISRPVYWYDSGNKQFGLDYSDNEITTCKDDFKSLYTSKLLSDGNSSALFTLNTTKTDQYNIRPTFTQVKDGLFNDGKSRQILGKGQTLLAGIFLNECMQIRLLGSTHLEVGTFIGIDRLGGGSKFDMKVCGQWFVINVKHLLTNNKYITDITAIKINTYEDLGITDGEVG